MRHFCLGAWLLVGLLACVLAQTRETCEHDPPPLSIIFITKRPGGFDVLLECLAQQTRQDFELLIVDDLNKLRHAQVADYARRLRVPLRAIVESKPKTRGRRFGQCNAINTGLVLSRAPLVSVVQDNVWLPSHFVDRTLRFFEDHKRDVLLSYPERRVAPPPGRLHASLMDNHSTLTIFSPPVTVDPIAEGWEIQSWNNTMTADIWSNIGKDEYIPTEWFECAACTGSWELYAALNGLDEALDVGDDSQEANVKERAVIMSERMADNPFGLGQTWNDLKTPVVLINHHEFGADETWARFERDTNFHRWRAMKDLMEFDEYPVVAPNEYSLAEVRRLDQNVVKSHYAMRDGVIVDVDWSFLPKHKLSEENRQQLKVAMAPRFGYKPEVIFLYDMAPEDEANWSDGLKETLRLLRRHFHMIHLNIGYMNLEDQPEIEFRLKDTFHFILAWGDFSGKADYFIRQYNERMNPRRAEKGVQLATFGILLRGPHCVPDAEAAAVYGVFICDSPWQERILKQEFPSLNVFQANGIDPRHLQLDALQEESLVYDYVVIGDLTSSSRPELLIDKEGVRLFAGRHVDRSSPVIEEELVAAGIRVERMPNATRRRELYRRSRVVYFPMTSEGSGDAMLLEAMASNANIEIEGDNDKLHELHAVHLEHGFVADSQAYADILVKALWSVLAPGALKN